MIFPLARRHLRVDALDVEPRVETGIEVLFDAGPAVRVVGADRAVIGTLRSRVAARGEAGRIIVFCAPQEILLLEAKPEIVVIIVDDDG